MVLMIKLQQKKEAVVNSYDLFLQPDNTWRLLQLRFYQITRKNFSSWVSNAPFSTRTSWSSCLLQNSQSMTPQTQQTPHHSRTQTGAFFPPLTPQGSGGTLWLAAKLWGMSHDWLTCEGSRWWLAEGAHCVRRRSCVFIRGWLFDPVSGRDAVWWRGQTVRTFTVNSWWE